MKVERWGVEVTPKKGKRYLLDGTYRTRRNARSWSESVARYSDIKSARPVRVSIEWKGEKEI